MGGEKPDEYYICIDQKSFYASVECVERNLDPLSTKLVVADRERTETTICLAVSPALKALGVKNRCRLYQIPKNIEYITAVPRMQLYIDYSARIYDIYLKYFAPEDIHVYSVDEAFIYVSPYLHLYGMSVRNLAKTVLKDIHDSLGLYATCGIGTNLYLAKIALDVISKHSRDFIGELDEDSYKLYMWGHMPLNDFWMIGSGTVRRLANVGIHTMKDIAMSDENLLFRIFGINAELLMDHAWGIETTTIHDIKNYKPQSTSLSSGQVLPRDYNYEECALIVKETCDHLCLELIKNHKVTDNVSLALGFSFLSGRYPVSRSGKLDIKTNSNRQLLGALNRMFIDIADPNGYYRRIYISFNNLEDEEFENFNWFTDIRQMQKDRKIQQAILELQLKYGKNSVLKCMDLNEAATTRERNCQIGGHRR